MAADIMTGVATRARIMPCAVVRDPNKKGGFYWKE